MEGRFQAVKDDTKQQLIDFANENLYKEKLIGKADSCPHKTLLEYCTTEIPELLERVKKVDLANRDVKNNALRINMKLNRFEEDIRPRQVKCDQDTAKAKEILAEHTIILDRQEDVVNNLVKTSFK